jgi:hypothetical protein
MRTVHTIAAAVALAGSIALSLPASAQRVCNEDCVGPLCSKRCYQGDRDLTVGRGYRDRDVIIEERRRHREPGVVIEERRHPGVDVEIRR